MEANLFQVFIRLQSDLIIRAIIIRGLNFKTKFKIEIEPKSSIVNIIYILKRDRRINMNKYKKNTLFRSSSCILRASIHSALSCKNKCI